MSVCEIQLQRSPFGKFVSAVVYGKESKELSIAQIIWTPKDVRAIIRKLLNMLDEIEDEVDDDKVEAARQPKYICSWTCAGEDDCNATSYMTGCEDKIVFEDGRAADAWDHKFCRKCGDMVMLHYENGDLMKIEDIIE